MQQDYAKPDLQQEKRYRSLQPKGVALKGDVLKHDIEAGKYDHDGYHRGTYLYNYYILLRLIIIHLSKD
jgi:hypothetical protein